MVHTVLLVSPYWKEPHRWMVSSVKLAELWKRLGYRVVVACMGSVTGDKRESTEQVSEALTIYRMKDVFLKDPWNYGIAFGFSGMVKRIIEEEKPDVIVINKLLFWTSLCVLPLRLKGRKVILLTDALVGMTWWPRGRLPRICAAIYAWTVGWLLLKLAGRIVFFHPQPEVLIRRLGIAEKAQVIPTGIDPMPYGKRAESDRQPLTITYIGRLESVKGVDDFLAAVVPLKSEYPQISIQVVGWHKDRHPLVERFRRDVLFTGLRDDIPEILAETDIFVLPSYSEGLSNALMEAMASGCACVASDRGGNSFLIHNGISGFLFPAGDREVLKGHVRRLIDDPAKRRAMGEAARKRIEEEFSWESVGKQYRELFTQYAATAS